MPIIPVLREAEAVRSGIPVQPRLHNEILSPKKKQKKERIGNEDKSLTVGSSPE
jgi:hypothetical protein